MELALQFLKILAFVAPVFYWPVSFFSAIQLTLFTYSTQGTFFCELQHFSHIFGRKLFFYIREGVSKKMIFQIISKTVQNSTFSDPGVQQSQQDS